MRIAINSDKYCVKHYSPYNRQSSFFCSFLILLYDYVLLLKHSIALYFFFRLFPRFHKLPRSKVCPLKEYLDCSFYRFSLKQSTTSVICNSSFSITVYYCIFLKNYSQLRTAAQVLKRKTAEPRRMTITGKRKAQTST